MQLILQAFREIANAGATKSASLIHANAIYLPDAI